MDVILTGDRPTGRLHLGHYVGSLKRRVEMQNSGKYHNIYVMIADAQALTDNADDINKVRNNISEVALDVTVSRLQRNPTVKNEIQLRGFKQSIPVGFFTYPISQASDITAFKANLIPVGEDQLPMIEQAREIVRSFNTLYKKVLVEPTAVLPENSYCSRLPGLDGAAKMSKSLGNCIYLADSANDIKKKVQSMFTDPTHLHVEDPGHIENNPVFTYLDAFCRDEHFKAFLPAYQNLDELKAHYQRGGLGDGTVKKFLNEILQNELKPIRERREELAKDIGEIFAQLKKGSENAREVAAHTLHEVKGAMGIDYFGKSSLL